MKSTSARCFWLRCIHASCLLAVDIALVPHAWYAAQREGQQRAEWAEQREALERSHACALEQQRQQHEAAQEGWRAALAEKLRREGAEAERRLREQLTRERDEEIEVCGMAVGAFWVAGGGGGDNTTWRVGTTGAEGHVQGGTQPRPCRSAV